MGLAAEYILPLKWNDDGPLEELADYLAQLPQWADITVVDGSPAVLFQRHADRLPPRVRHVRPEISGYGNGKVMGVVTGIRIARHDRLVIADDDVRYRAAELEQVVRLLDAADLVRPQNYFSPMPWHARWDTARTLLNRALASDYPGTLAVRRSLLDPANAYSADALFENLELIRTLRARGGRQRKADDVFVVRRPPTARHFLGQRVRQAYDSFAQPGRLGVELALLPFGVFCARRPRRLLTALLAVVALAEVGRRRHGGQAIFGPMSALWAPSWVLERSICIWVAILYRLRGGVPYAGQRMKLAAHSNRWLRRAHQQSGAVGRSSSAPEVSAGPPPKSGPRREKVSRLREYSESK